MYVWFVGMYSHELSKRFDFESFVVSAWRGSSNNVTDTCMPAIAQKALREQNVTHIIRRVVVWRGAQPQKRQGNLEILRLTTWIGNRQTESGGKCSNPKRMENSFSFSWISL